MLYNLLTCTNSRNALKRGGALGVTRAAQYIAEIIIITILSDMFVKTLSRQGVIDCSRNFHNISDIWTSLTLGDAISVSQKLTKYSCPDFTNLVPFYSHFGPDLVFF